MLPPGSLTREPPVTRRVPSAPVIRPVDVLVNAAGVSSFGTADTIDEAEWNRVLDINLKAPFYLTRAFLPLLEAALHRLPIFCAAIEPSPLLVKGRQQWALKYATARQFLTNSLAQDWDPDASAIIRTGSPSMTPGPVPDSLSEPPV